LPELPEVETVRRRLAPALVGRTIEAAEILDARLTRPHDPREVASELVGEAVAEVARRGKYLLIRLASGATIVSHLRMTGNFVLGEPGDVVGVPFLRAWLALSGGGAVAYTDIRRFGTWDVLPDRPSEDAYLSTRVGPEPLSDAFTPAVLRAALARRSAPVKSVLLDQTVVAGVGNIYADEALHLARVHPRAEARRLSAAKVAVLAGAIRSVLELGIAAQGASIRDYRTPDGAYGSMQERFHAYGLTGEPCSRCATPIRRIVVGGRATHFCPRCQRLPRASARA
jgi:formamidopyrimidine-DNA glycosylase